MNNYENSIEITYEEYKSAWLEINDIFNPNYSTLEKGRLFARKLISEYFNFSDDFEIYQPDGSKDGGIDLAFKIEGENYYEETSDSEEGDTFYIVQSKYGSAYYGNSTILTEANKVFGTLTGQNTNLSYQSRDIVEKANNFLEYSTEQDKIVLLFITEDPLSENELKTLEDIRLIGKKKFNNKFDTHSLSINNIYELDEKKENKKILKVDLKGNFVSSGNNLLVGVVKLVDLFDFLSDYKRKTGNSLDELYEKNVRQYLGFKGKINSKIKETLTNNVDKFGLYNNGITIVVNNFTKSENEKYTLCAPYIVNGCQTTRTIWDILDKYASVCGVNSSMDWKENYKDGIVIVKIAKIIDDIKLLEDITKFTNSQNTVKEKDFISLNQDFRNWKIELDEKYNIYLEIQRGAWASQVALQKKQMSPKEYSKWVNAFDLIKIYGAAWLGYVGTAFGKNPPFSPKGTIFNEIVNQDDFSSDDLYAAFILMEKANQYKLEIRSLRYLYCRVVVELLKPIILNIDTKFEGNIYITQSFLKLKKHPNEFNLLLDTAKLLINDYNDKSNENSIFKEPSLIVTSDLNKYLKNSKLGKDMTYCPKLNELIKIYQVTFKFQQEGSSRFDMIKCVLEDIKFKKLNSSNTPYDYARSIPELNHLVSNHPNLYWADICRELEIEIGIQSARVVLRNWVKKNKKNWLPVPDAKNK